MIRSLAITFGLFSLALAAGHAQAQFGFGADIEPGTLKASPETIHQLVSKLGPGVYHRISSCVPPPAWGTGSPADEAAATLVRIGRPAVPAIVPLATEKDEATRALVIEILGRIRGSQVFPILVRSLKTDESDRVRESAAEALDNMNDRPSAGVLVSGLRDSNRAIQWHAAKALARYPCRDALKPLVELLRAQRGVDENAPFGFFGPIPSADAAAVALGSLGTPAWPSIQRLYDDPDPHLHKLAVTAVTFCEDRRAIPILLQLTHAPDDGTRVGACAALRRWDDPRSVRALASVLNGVSSPPGTARAVAAMSLAYIGGEFALHELFAAFKSSDPNLRYVAHSAFAEIRDRRSVPRLREALRSDDRRAVSSAMFRLATWQEPRAISALIVKASDPDMETRRAAVGSLGQYRDPRVVPPLLKALSDSQEQVRILAAGVVALQNDARVEPALRRLLNDPSPDVRRNAELSLKVHGQQRSRVKGRPTF